MKARDIPPIDLVVVNLYPFREAVAAGKPFAECVEEIDIGGPDDGAERREELRARGRRRRPGGLRAGRGRARGDRARSPTRRASTS